MRVLVTGAGGFVGRHICQQLAAAGVEVIAIGRSAGAVAPYATSFVEISKIPSHEDLLDVLRRYEPSLVYHLAGAVTAPSLQELYEVNVFYGVALMEACRQLNNPPKVIIAGSAAEYGNPVSPGRLMTEGDPTLPLGPYGITKLAQTAHALAQAEVPVVVARIFNAVGASMPASTAIGSFVHKLARLGGTRGVVTTGPLNSVRDLADVAAIARTLVELGNMPTPARATYNICTGLGTRMSEVVAILGDLISFPVLFDSSQSRDPGVEWAVGNPSRLADDGLVVNSPDLVDVLRRMLVDADISLRSRRMG